MPSGPTTPSLTHCFVKAFLRDYQFSLNVYQSGVLVAFLDRAFRNFLLLDGACVARRFSQRGMDRNKHDLVRGASDLGKVLRRHVAGVNAGSR